MDKRFWGILIAIAIILGGIFWATSNGSGTTTSNKPTNHVEGENKDNITLVEYGDYECPYCGEYYSVVKQVQQEYNTQILFQFRNLPLTQIHQNAFAGARAAEAAGLMGKFWQMHDLLYEQNVLYYGEKQSNWVGSNNPETFFDSYAQQLGLNVTQFNQYYSSDTVNNLINADVTVFDKTGQEEATPTFFLDGTKINPSISVSSFEQYINAEIAKKTGKGSSSTTTPATPSTSSTQSVQ
jgi:protein-disulfide isomerase